MDLATALTILGGEQFLEKILGPSFEYIGNNLKLLTEKMHHNLASVFSSTKKKLGKRINEAGSVSPKVLKSILENGAWCEEELQAEYFGGILASSRTDSSRDDRGAYYASIITSMTTYQIRLHYLVYMEIRRLFVGHQLNVAESRHREQMLILIPFTTYIEAMEFSELEMKSFDSIFEHSAWGLHNAALVDGCWYGKQDYLENHFPGVTEDGIILKPSLLGAELFMWAYGYGQYPANALLDPSISFIEVDSIPLGRVLSVKDIKAHKVK